MKVNTMMRTMGLAALMLAASASLAFATPACPVSGPTVYWAWWTPAIDQAVDCYLEPVPAGCRPLPTTTTRTFKKSSTFSWRWPFAATATAAQVNTFINSQLIPTAQAGRPGSNWIIVDLDYWHSTQHLGLAGYTQGYLRVTYQKMSCHRQLPDRLEELRL